MNVDDYETWNRGGVSPTLNAFDNATETRATVIVTSGYDEYNDSISPELHHTLRAGTPQSTGVIVTAPTLTAANDPSRSPQSSEVTAQVESVVAATNATCVRRLTPIECERLQGFPDNWTAGLADTHRYKQMGNAVTVNVAHYIGWLLADA